MGALERRRRSEKGCEDCDGAHHRFPRLQRVGDDVCALLAVPLGEVSSVYSLYARRAAALFAAMDSDRCGRAYDEFLSAASSRTRSFGVVLKQACLGLGQARNPTGPTLRLLPSLLRRRRVLSAGHAFVCRGLVYGLCCFPFSSSSERRATPSLGSLASFKPPHLSHL